MDETLNETLVNIDTTEEDLLYSNNATDLKLRIFNTIAGSSLIGIILSETEDSFLVGLPTKLMAYGDKRAIEPEIPLPFTRKIKSTILSVLPCFGEFEIFYIQYLLKEGKRRAPKIITREYEAALIKRAVVLKDILETMAAEKAEKEKTTRSISFEEAKDVAGYIITQPGSMKNKH